MEQIVLASNSPRRKEILTQAGVSFTVIPSTAEENSDKKDPKEYVKELSYKKAMDVFLRTKEDITVIGSDTVVAIGEHILLKPVDEEDAFHILKQLSDKSHEVCTGVTIIKRKGTEVTSETFCESAKVFVTKLSDEEIRAYIATKEPMDKAGAYAIQGRFAQYIKRIEGDYYAIVGLPICHVMEVLKKIK